MKGISNAVEMTDERIKEILARPIDYSDIPEMSDEEYYRSWVRLPNQPLDKGGAWHKPVRRENLSEEVRRKVDEMVRLSEEAEAEAVRWVAARDAAQQR